MSGVAELVFLHALSLSVPSTDGLRGAQITYERFLPELDLALGVSAEVRQTATGDYTGVHTGLALGGRKFWRADRGARLSTLPAGSPVGWFFGGAVRAGTTVTHDDMDDAFLGTTLQLGVSVEIGYRIAPWRQLVITPAVGAEVHRDIDLSGRMRAWNVGGFTAGLELGWLF